MAMVTLIRNAKVYQPEYAGVRDILVLGGKIAAEGEKLQADLGVSLEVEELDGEGMAAVPGFIDSHEHILGGGGEGGFETRTPEAELKDLIMNGITTVAGCIGTDSVGRDMTALLAKAHALENEGISTYAYTGSYRVPVKTLTDSLMKDIMMLDKVIGVGEVAISDHRSSQPTFEEFARMPVFNEKGEYQGIGIGKASCLLKEVRECVLKEGIPLEIAVKGITSNVSSILKLGAKGRIREGFDADICLLTEDTLELKTVMAKGQLMVKDGKQLVFGTFEK